MQKIQLVKKVLGDRFAKHGFDFAGSVHRGMWEFKKTLENDVFQSIRIFISPHDSHSVYLEIYTSYYFIERAKAFAKEDPKYIGREYWHFKDDEEFVGVLEEMGDLIEKHGLKRLSEMSIPPYKYTPTEEMYRKLYENHDGLSAKFKKEHNISENITLKESTDVIKRIVEQGGERLYDDETKDSLIEAAAFYGERIIKRYYGNWAWYEPRKICNIENIKINYFDIDVLIDIVKAWEKANADALVLNYENMIDREQYKCYVGGKTIDPKINYDY